MQTTATRFGTFEEPELLGGYMATAPGLTDDFEPLLERIERALETELEPPSAWQYTGTQIRYEPNFVSTFELFSKFTVQIVPESALAAAVNLAKMSPAIALPFLPHLNLAIAATDWVKISKSIIGLPATFDVMPAIPAFGSDAESPRSHLDTCLDEVQRWLGVGLGDVTDAAGIARSTVYTWRERNSTPRPATVATVLRVHGLVSSAVKAVGEDGAREWFHNGDPSPLAEMIGSKGDAAKLRRVSARMRRELLAVPLPPPDSRLSVTIEDLIH